MYNPEIHLPSSSYLHMQIYVCRTFYPIHHNVIGFQLLHQFHIVSDPYPSHIATPSYNTSTYQLYIRLPRVCVFQCVFRHNVYHQHVYNLTYRHISKKETCQDTEYNAFTYMDRHIMFPCRRLFYNVEKLLCLKNFHVRYNHKVQGLCRLNVGYQV